MKDSLPAWRLSAPTAHLATERLAMLSALARASARMDAASCFARATCSCAR